MASVVDGNGGSGGQVLTELGHLKELVRKLEVHLGGSPELCKHLASQISCITDRSISLLVTTASIADAAATPGPLSDASDAPFKPAKKRKQTVDKKRYEVRVSSAAGGDHPADDGHSWRKYGQKEILGAKHPRAYYRCTHRNSQGCAAIKQVQRTDEDATCFDVVYLGEHSCAQNQTAAAGQGRQAATDAPAPEHNPGATSLLQSLSSNLTVKTEGLAVAEPEPEPLQGWGATTPFCFSSTPASGCLAPERSPFSAPSTSENWGVSPATSDSNHVVPFPPFEVAGGVQFGFQEAMSAFVPADDFVEDDFDVSSFLNDSW